jgi:hypothetical protein
LLAPELLAAEHAGRSALPKSGFGTVNAISEKAS